MSATRKQVHLQSADECSRRDATRPHILCLLILALTAGCDTTRSPWQGSGGRVPLSRASFFQNGSPDQWPGLFRMHTVDRTEGIESGLSRPEAARILQEDIGLWDPNRHPPVSPVTRFRICYVPEFKDRIRRSRLLPDGAFLLSLDEFGLTYKVSRRFIDSTSPILNGTRYHYHIEDAPPAQVAFADIARIKWVGTTFELDAADKRCLIRFDSEFFANHKQRTQFVSALSALCPNAN